MKNLLQLTAATTLLSLAPLIHVTADQVILDDVIVDGSACIGVDCVNGENFGFDTIRLKENNLRIKFQDTSSSASFPTNDWQITVNDTSNGGANRFSIDDIDNNRTPFTIEASAPSHSLYVDDAGRVGLGTSIPDVEMHVVDGNTPTTRLEQDGSSGFTPQTWDVAGNEANFFVRDVTNDSRLPFRIKPGAPDDSIFVAASGNVGIGNDSPTATLHIVRNDGTAQTLVQETSSTTGPRNMFELNNNGPIGFNMFNSNLNQRWRFAAQITGFRVSLAGTGGPEMEVGNSGTLRVGSGGSQQLFLDTSGNLTIAGTLTQSSSRELKENLEPVDGSEMLQKLVALPITRWNYKSGARGDHHLGPTAEDFYATFALGRSDKHVAPSDMAAVTMVASQQLHAQVVALRGRLSAKDKLIGELRRLLEAQGALIESQGRRIKALEALMPSADNDLVFGP